MKPIKKSVFDFIVPFFRQLIVQAPEDLKQLYTQVVQSPSNKYFLLLMVSFVGFIFIVGMFCGRVARRSAVSKNK